MSGDRKAVTLPLQDYATAAARAQAGGLPVARWIGEAIADKARREALVEVAAFMARPDVAADMGGWADHTYWPDPEAAA